MRSRKIHENKYICSSEVIHSPKYSYFKFIFIYNSEIISQPSNYTAHNNPKIRISRLDWHVYLFYQWAFLRVRFEPATFQLQAAVPKRGGWGVYIPPNNWTPSPPIITKCIPPNILNLPNFLNGDHLVLRT